MIVLLDRGKSDINQAGEELGVDYGQLLTPLTMRDNAGMAFAIDNGGFARFKGRSFLSLLNRERQNRNNCLFVASPDIVGNARRTLECFDFWREKLHGWPIALVAQDGQENLDIPWTFIDAIFIGGSTRFKLSQDVIDICKAARICNKWVHVGRVNTPERFDKFLDIADSIDGTGISQYSHMRKELAIKTPLFSEEIK